MKKIKLVGNSLPAVLLLACCINTTQADQTLSTAGPVLQTLQNNLYVSTPDIFLNVWDQTAGDSYNVDLGVNLHTFIAEAATTNITWNLDSYFKSFASAGNPLTFNIAGVDENGNVKTSTNDSVLLSYPTGLESSTFAASLNYHLFATNQTLVNNYIETLSGNVLITHSGAQSAEIVTDQNNPAYFGSTTWGIGEGTPGVLSAVSGGGGANELSVLFLNTPGGSVTNGTVIPQTLPAGYFSLNAANDTLVWNANSTAVPLPGAVWLFVGGLLGLLGSQKSRLAQKA